MSHRPATSPPWQEHPLRGPDGHLAWAGLCSTLALASLVATTGTRPQMLVWHATAWPHHPWMLWTASLVHMSAAHWLVNLGALLVLAVLGLSLRAQWPATLAVLLAWPLGTLALMAWPQVGWYAGMSGLLTAMLAALCVHAWRPGSRIASSVLLAALALKLLVEQAWSHPIAFEPSFGFNVVNAAHLTGAAAGTACAMLVRSLLALRSRKPPDTTASDR